LGPTPGNWCKASISVETASVVGEGSRLTLNSYKIIPIIPISNNTNISISSNQIQKANIKNQNDPTTLSYTLIQLLPSREKREGKGVL